MKLCDRVFGCGAVRLIGVLLAALAACCVAASSAAAAEVINTIPVGQFPSEVSSDGTHVWVTNRLSETVSEIDPSTATVIHTIFVGRFPRGVSSDGTHVWVANERSDTVSEIDPSTATIIHTITVGSEPADVSSDGTHVWVTTQSSFNQFSESVSEIDPSTATVIHTIPVGGDPEGVSSDGTHVWVTNRFSNTVSEIDPSTATVIHTIPVGSDPDGVSSDGTHVWVTNRFSNTVSEIDPSTATVIHTIPVGSDPFGVSSDGTRVWVANEFSGTVSEIDPSTATVIETIPVGSDPRGVSSDGTHVWVTNFFSNTVSELLFGLAPAPTVMKVEPNSGPAAGGTSVTITGANFTGATAVNFQRLGEDGEVLEGTGAASFTVNSDTSITAVSPALPPITGWSGFVSRALVDVTVRTPSGTSPITGPATPPDVSDEFSYQPAVTGVEPSTSLAGGTDVRIVGNGFTATSKRGTPPPSWVTAVKFGSANATGFRVNGEDEIDAVAPPGTGTVDVTVTTLAGTSPTNAADQLTYRPASSTSGVIAWGAPDGGSLGGITVGGCWVAEMEYAECSTDPLLVSGLNRVAGISAGGQDNMALLGDGTVMAWGDNGFGQLGDGEVDGPEICVDNIWKPGPSRFFPCSRVPVAVKGLSGVTAASAGGEHSLALLKDGTVMAWGASTGPEKCGRRAETPCSTVPVTVSGLSGVTAIAAGAPNLALLKNGTVIAWGGKPVQVSGLSGVTAIAAGGSYSLALLRNGRVMAWGDNRYGQLGDGTTTASDVPVPVSGLSGVAAIAAGGEHSLAVLRNGTVMGWGANEYGQLGDGSTTASDVPVPVSGLSGVTAASAGGEHSLALLRNGTVMAWGRNRFGQLGDGIVGRHVGHPSTCFEEENACSTIPVAVSGHYGVTAIAAGEDHSLAYIPRPLPPTVNEVKPNHGPASGGTTVTISGTHFTGATEVEFGSKHAISFTVSSATSITAVSPPGTGAVDVSVTTPDGTSTISEHDHFKFT